MRKVFVFNLITLDGFFEGPNQDISWHNADNQEFGDFAIEQLAEIDTILFGRVTYEMMATFWPSKEALEADPETAKFMNEKEKFVFSHTLNSADWNNTTLIKTDAADEIRKLKAQEGKAIAIFGSSDLTLSLIDSDVIDEYRLLVNPLFIGDGKRFLQGLTKRFDLKLINSRVFESGNVLLTYTKK